jgi:hypothetical protein
MEKWALNWNPQRLEGVAVEKDLEEDGQGRSHGSGEGTESG